ncbi:hypothetical protein GCM10022224_075020 [Nonomuraea antimicrobica]|uniref:Uncharacterized protein n=1 Tax=Nonomuraea antimicrobica TaxID=561173 RepID=A0ABP7CXR9_9ACTN
MVGWAETTSPGAAARAGAAMSDMIDNRIKDMLTRTRKVMCRPSP